MDLRNDRDITTLASVTMFGRQNLPWIKYAHAEISYVFIVKKDSALMQETFVLFSTIVCQYTIVSRININEKAMNKRKIQS